MERIVEKSQMESAKRIVSSPGPSSSPFVVIAGPCVIEDEGMVLETAQEIKKLSLGLPIDIYFKSSFDKANRSSIHSFRGPGLQAGLKILEKIRWTTDLKVLTDFHEATQAEPVAQTVDYLQIPAFLCRQTDLVVAGAKAAKQHKRKLNIKKGQFLAPWDIKNILAKIQECAGELKTNLSEMPLGSWVTVTERGTSFGYNTLVVDMISIQCIHENAVPAIFDATHSVQTPGGGVDKQTSGGKREFIETLSRSAMAAGADGIFLECHPDPSTAKSDGPNSLPLECVGDFIRQMLQIHQMVRSLPKVL